MIPSLNDYTLKVITGESGYFFKTDEHPIETGRGRLLSRAGRFVLPLPNGLIGCPGVKIRLQ